MAAHPEGAHEVAVALQRRAPPLEHDVVRPQREALRVVVAVLVRVHDVGVINGRLPHKRRQRDGHHVAHVRAARVERHHRLTQANTYTQTHTHTQPKGLVRQRRCAEAHRFWGLEAIIGQRSPAFGGRALSRSPRAPCRQPSRTYKARAPPPPTTRPPSRQLHLCPSASAEAEPNRWPEMVSSVKARGCRRTQKL
eukprot:3846049-Pyramimonas_sp.AAC.1